MFHLCFFPFIAFLVSAVFAYVSMPWLLRLCKRRGLYDMPNDRKVHKNKIPRLGGVLFMPATALGISAALIAMMAFGLELPSFKVSTFLIISGIFLIYLVGLLDDVLGLPARFKFLVQFVASLFMPFCSLYINDLYGFCGLHQIPVLVGYPLTIFLSLLIVNSINLIDGIDGLASGLSVLALGVYTVVYLQLNVVGYAMFTAALLGGVLVFMYFNLFGSEGRGTKTFMGDTGSLILGYALAFLTFKYAMDAPALLPRRPQAILLAFTLLIVPVFDLIRVALERLFRRESIFHADKTHIHHKCLAAGFSMRASLFVILGLQAFFNVAGLIFYLLEMNITLIVTTDIVLFALFHVWLNRRIARQEQLKG
ncbi:MAG: glycosyltransferase family 4 protein [Alloprevotella sp.]